MAFRRAYPLDHLWEGEMAGVVVEGRKVLLVRLEGAVRAFEDRCMHQCVALSGGRLDGKVLTCSAHEWQYDACTGRGLNPERMELPRYPVKVEDGAIWVDVDASVPTEVRDFVGPVLQAGAVGAAVVTAILSENPEAQVIDRGAYLRVLAPGRCAVTRDAIERTTGGPFQLPGDLEAVMSSFKGRFSVSETGAAWEFHGRRPPGGGTP